MKTLTLLLLALCAFATANVPFEWRSAAMNLRPDPKAICAPQTPCAWSVYRPLIKMIEVNITNSYCECAKGLECQRDEDDVSVNSYILRCKPPGEEEDL